KAPARSAALPLCSSTTTTRTRQFRIKKGFRIQVPPQERRKPITMIANTMANATAHFIQEGISISYRTPSISGPTARISPDAKLWPAAGKLRRWSQAILRRDSLRPPTHRPVLPAPSVREYCPASRCHRRECANRRHERRRISPPRTGEEIGEHRRPFQV